MATKKTASPGRTAPTYRAASLPARFFGVYVDPVTWGALVYVLLGLVTGIIYFTWAVTGLSLSLGLLVLIIGIPFIFLFLFSVRGLALAEMAILGALLGAHFRSQPLFPRKNMGWGERLKSLLTDRRTWLSQLYMILQLPITFIYFSVTTILLALALGLVALPFIFAFADPQGFITIGRESFRPDTAMQIAFAFAGFLLLTVTLHAVRGIGRLHAKYAQGLLSG